MGSSGSGSFSDYSGRKPGGSSGGAGSGGAGSDGDGSGGGGSGGGGSGGGGSGGGSGQDRCLRAFSASLEDVGLYPLYTSTGTVPAVGAILTVAQTQRLVAIDPSGVEVGALPTSLNYVAGCMQDGHSYSGVVRSSSTTPVPRVDVDFAPV